MPEKYSKMDFFQGSIEQEKSSTTYLLSKVQTTHNYQESAAVSVIQVAGTVESEDGLRTGVLPGGCW